MGMPMVTADQVVPPVSKWGRIYQTMRNTLDAYVNYFGEHEVQLPTDESGAVVAFVSDGTPVYDRSMLVIEFASFQPGAPGVPSSAAIMGDTEYSVTGALALIRPVPTLKHDGVPHPDEREEAAQSLLLDAATLVEGALFMTARAMEGSRGTMVGAPYRRVQIQNIVPYGPEGPVAGNLATLVMELV